MRSKDLKKEIAGAVAASGKHSVVKVLVAAGLGASTAEKLAGGRYPNEIGVLLGAAIQRAIEALKQKAS